MLGAISTVVALGPSVPLGPADMALLCRLLSTRPLRPPPKVVVLKIDAQDIERHETDRPETCTCPLVPRWLLARGIDTLASLHVGAIVLDLTFDHPCLLHDGALSRAMERSGLVIVAMDTLVREAGVQLVPPSDTVKGYRALASPAVYAPYGRVLAVQAIQGASYRTVGTPAGPLVMISDVRLPLGLAAWCVVKDEPVGDVELQTCHSVRVGSLVLPVIEALPIHLMSPLLPPLAPEQGQHALLVSWWGPKNTFPVISLRQVLAGEVDPGLIRDAVVIIGDEREERSTPLGAMSGPEVQANIAATILARRWFRPVSFAAHWALAFAGSVAATLLITMLPGFIGAVGVVAEGGGVLYLCRLAVNSDRWLLGAPILLAIACSALIAALVDQIQQQRARQWLAREMELRDQLASELAHDCRNHLATLSRTLEQLLRRLARYGEDLVDPRAAEIIQRQLRSLEREVTTLLDADPDHVMTLRLSPVELLSMIRGVAADIAASAPRHRIEVIGQPLTVKADAPLLERAVWNLVHNAVKYSPRGGKVTVELSASDGLVQVSVTDEGIGIEQDKLDRLFARFVRVVPQDSGITGTGLGLYSVKRAAEAHGGSVDVKSQVGVGSTFVIRLPAQSSPPEESHHDAETLN